MNKKPQAIFWPIPSKDFICNPVLMKIKADWRGIEENKRIIRLENGRAKGKIE